jgi:energy-coupling factor transporter ATP-binding protein EcfA2
MYRYKAFALSIQSDLELPGLPETSTAQGPPAEPDVLIKLGEVRPVARGASPDEEFAVNVTQAGRFHVRRGREIVVDLKPHGDPEILRAMLLGRVMAYLLRQRGWLPLHGSGVVLSGRAVLFLGDSGAGKSTTAAAFHACGHPVATDEVGAVRVIGGRCELRTAGTRLRLTPDSLTVLGERFEAEPANGKHAVPVCSGELPDNVPIARIYVLDYGDSFTAETIEPLRAVQTLSVHSFISRRGMNAEVSAVHLKTCAAVAAAVPVQRLVRPRSLEALRELVGFIEKELAMK